MCDSYLGNNYMNKLTDKVIKWHQDRIIKGSTDQAQILKLIEELGTSNSVCKARYKR